VRFGRRGFFAGDGCGVRSGPLGLGVIISLLACRPRRAEGDEGDLPAGIEWVREGTGTGSHIDSCSIGSRKCSYPGV
jgi:hypothetical protein